MEKENEFDFFRNIKSHVVELPKTEKFELFNKDFSFGFAIIEFAFYLLAIYQGFAQAYGIENSYKSIFIAVGVAGGANLLKNIFNLKSNKLSFTFLLIGIFSLFLISGFPSVRDMLLPFVAVFFVAGFTNLIINNFSKFFKLFK